MSDILLSWTLPDVSGKQAPISSVRIERRISTTLPWSPHADVPVEETELLLVDEPPGTHYFRGTVVDENGAENADDEKALAQAQISFDPPSPLVAFEATVVSE